MMDGFVLFLAVAVWIVSYIRLPKWSYPQVNIVQRSNFATLNCLIVILIYIMFLLSDVIN